MLSLSSESNIVHLIERIVKYGEHQNLRCDGQRGAELRGVKPRNSQKLIKGYIHRDSE